MRGWGALFAVAVALASLAIGAGRAAASEIPVLAFYYPWYNPNDFSRSAMWDVPVNPYQSDSRDTIQRQLRQARDAGLTGFISSWMGPGNRTDKNFATLMELSRGTGFFSTIYLETGSDGLSTPGQVVDALRYVASRYGSLPSFARIGGKPAIFIWNPGAIGGPDVWTSVRAQVDPGRAWHWNVETDRPEQWLGPFDGVHLFSAASWVADATATYRAMRSRVDAVAARTGQPKLWAAGVAPGWDNSLQGNPARVIVDRQGGSYYAQRWEAAIASSPDLVTITSWNEWGEGTAIEPGSTFGTLYLDITRTYSSRLRMESGTAGAAGYAFRLGFAELAGSIPDVVGRPVEDEHHGANGDALQQTTTGLMVWRKADNWTAFTDGSRTWVRGPYGVQVRSNDQRFPWEDRG